MRIDLPQYEVIHARARRERAEAVHALLIQPLIGFIKKLWAGPAARPASSRRVHA